MTTATAKEIMERTDAAIAELITIRLELAKIIDKSDTTKKTANRYARSGYLKDKRK